MAMGKSPMNRAMKRRITYKWSISSQPCLMKPEDNHTAPLMGVVASPPAQSQSPSWQSLQRAATSRVSQVLSVYIPSISQHCVLNPIIGLYCCWVNHGKAFHLPMHSIIFIYNTCKMGFKPMLFAILWPVVSLHM